MTAPQARSGGLDSNARGLIVLGVAVVVGVLLLANMGGGGGGGSADTKDEASAPATTGDLTASTTELTTTTSSSASTRTPSEVSVLVLNGGGPAGSAGTTSDQIGQSGYTMGTPDNGPTVAATTVYYAPDYQAEATDIASLLGQTPDVVKPLSDSEVGDAAGSANVVVVLGPNAPPVSSTTTTTIG